MPLIEAVPQAQLLARLPAMTPEQRLVEFDSVVNSLSSIAEGASTIQRQILALIAGYLATVAAGGTPNLGLVGPHAKRFPEIVAWAYVVGSIGEQIVCTSGFDGLGRLVARELARPFRLDEAPTCDFLLDEAKVLVDVKLADPLVHLRIKQSRIVMVSLLPGVNVLIPITPEPAAEDRRNDKLREYTRAESRRDVHAAQDPLAVLADAIWPYLRNRLSGLREGSDLGTGYVNKSRVQQDRGRKRGGKQEKLPLK